MDMVMFKHPCIAGKQFDTMRRTEPGTWERAVTLQQLARMLLLQKEYSAAREHLKESEELAPRLPKLKTSRRGGRLVRRCARKEEDLASQKDAVPACSASNS